MAKKISNEKKKKASSSKKGTKSKKAQKKDQQGPKFSIKEFMVIALVFLVIGCLAWMVNSMHTYFVTSPMFMVKKISTNVAINYDLKAQNIFKVDLKTVEKQIRKRHPEFKSVRVNRAFPDVLEVQVIERKPFFQIEKKAYYMLDKEGIVVAGPSDVPYDQIIVYPSFAKRTRFALGNKVEFDYFDNAMELISYLNRYNASKAYTIKELRVPSLNQVNFILDTIEVRIGEGNYSHKIDILFERILPQYNHDFEKIEYIDLRFNDYVIGYKK